VKLAHARLWPVLIAALIVVVVCLLQALPALLPGFLTFERLEWMTYDWRVRQTRQSHPEVSDRLGFVNIGDDAIAVFSEGQLGTHFQFGLYWPRQIYGRVVRELKAQGASVIGLDVLFGERRFDHRPVPTSQGLVESDRFLQQQLQQAGNVVLGATRQVVPHPLFRSSALAIGDISTDRDVDGVLRRARVFHDYRVWHPAIQAEARLNNWDLSRAVVLNNHVLFPPPKGRPFALAINPDGYFDPAELHPGRATPPAGGLVRLQKAFEDLRVWHLGVVLAATELGCNLDQAVVELERHRIVLNGTNGVTRVLPVDRHGRLLIDWCLSLNDPRLTKDAFETLVAQDLQRANGEEVPTRFRDALVVIGSTASGNDLSDRGATPLEKDTFLTSNHWNVASSILTGRFIREASPLLASLLVVMLGGLAAVLTWGLRALWATLSVALAGALYVWANVSVFANQRLWLPLVLPLGGLLLTHFALVSYQAFFEQSERRRIRRIFTKIVSPNVVAELLKAEKLSLVGARRKVSVLFADVRGFTDMTDATHARAEEYVRTRHLPDQEAEAYLNARSQEVLETVNLYLGLVADTVIKHHGTLDKYIGDCVMAFWGAPTPNDRHAVTAVRAAIEGQRAIHALNTQRAAENQRRERENPDRAARGEAPLPCLSLLTLGTGINTGVVTVGLMGSDAHIVNYTAFGREVNLAARLESLSGHSRILIGEATYLELLQDDPVLAAACTELPPVTVKGFRAPVKAFEVPWLPAAAPTGNTPAGRPALETTG
jgi:class 3 adenylate cyclase